MLGLSVPKTFPIIVCEALGLEHLAVQIVEIAPKPQSWGTWAVGLQLAIGKYTWEMLVSEGMVPSA